MSLEINLYINYRYVCMWRETDPDNTSASKKKKKRKLLTTCCASHVQRSPLKPAARWDLFWFSSYWFMDGSQVPCVYVCILHVFLCNPNYHFHLHIFLACQVYIDRIIFQNCVRFFAPSAYGHHLSARKSCVTMCNWSNRWHIAV